MTRPESHSKQDHMGGISQIMSFPSPVKRLRGEGKEMVPERPPCDHVGTGTQLSSAHHGSTHLCPDRASLCCRGAGRGGR